MEQQKLEELIEQAAREKWQTLDLRYNKLNEIPEVIARLTNLQTLDLSYNLLNEIPEAITRLTNLQILYLSNNNINEIPEVITRLTNLQTLGLDTNIINEIPEAIARLTNLQTLGLDTNIINEIPEVITRLTNLQSLNLGNNSISKIPESITKLTNLESLNLSNNSLNEIPKSITKLSNLQYLYLIDNSISEILEEITRLTNLKYLCLGINRISEISEAITRLTNLESLDLSGNSISKIPESIIGLTNLESLDLSHNRLNEIPEVITRLTNLKSLKLNNNSISEIPESITRLTNLQFLRLYGNPVISPPIDIVEEGIQAIREYFRQLETEGRDYLYEAKLLILGEGGAGKTTLGKKIVNPDYQLCEEDSTKGIEVTKWKFERSDSKTFTVNIWDFGGQEIYHATHQYFLTKRSLYVLVADTRKEDTDFYYWLNVVELLSDNSPILIIKNEKQERQREININQLRGEFSNLQDTLPTNLATNRGLDKILDTLKFHLNQLPHIGSALPQTWVRVRAALDSDSRNYISFDEYLHICQTNGFKEHRDKLQLSEYLHDLGVCLYFGDDPLLKRTIILKSKWGTDAAYAVLDNEQVIKNNGCFTRSDLANIWSNDEYASMQDELLQLMMKFQLCYEIPQIKGSYIAPQLLAENQPEYFWDETENLILRYTYEFMPKGILTQFIVAMHQQIDDQKSVWRSGIIIKSKTVSNTRAEVIENYGRREIKIRVSGKNKKELLAIVTYELDKIHDSYQRLKYQKLIPCNCTTCQGSQSPHFYKFTDLKRRHENNKRAVECEISYEEVYVLSLIDDIGARDQLQDSRTNPDLEKLIDYTPKERVNVVNNIYVNNQNQSTTMTQEQPDPKPPTKPSRNPWTSGSFFLVALAVIALLTAFVSNYVPLLALPIVLIFTLLAVGVVGAFQLRNDEGLSEKNFMELMLETYKRLPLLRKDKSSDKSKDKSPN